MSNKWVVPYSPFLALKYNAHINVELCSTVQSVKYLYKYIYKGHDCANVEIKLNAQSQSNMVVYDEISKFLSGRYVSALEASWRIFKYDLSYKSHSISRLAVHLPFEQSVYFKAGQEDDALNRANNRDTTLTAWFKLNRTDFSARQFLYHDIPNHYCLVESKGWKKRANYDDSVIGRMYNVSAQEQERYYLRLLLLHVTGACSFDDLKTFNGITYGTFRDAAIERKLLKDDTHSENCLEELISFKMPNQLRSCFSMMCHKKFKNYLYEDFDSTNNQEYAENMLLIELDALFRQHKKSCSIYGRLLRARVCWPCIAPSPSSGLCGPNGLARSLFGAECPASWPQLARRLRLLAGRTMPRRSLSSVRLAWFT